MLQFSAAGAAVLGAKLALPELASAAQQKPENSDSKTDEERLYRDLLQTWCDGLVARQVTGLTDTALRGGLLCPACGLIHGRCGDAVYPLLHMAHSTGDGKYLRAALRVYDWSES